MGESSMYNIELGRFTSANDDWQEKSVNDNYTLDVGDLDRVQRRLKQRHIQMIAIAGTVGTGLFFASGQAIATAGPLGALIAYALVGTVAYTSLCALGEMTSHAPISGTFPHYASRLVDPAYGFALGWNYYITAATAIPVEITAAELIITFWNGHDRQSHVITAVLCICVSLINLFSVRWFGESEFIFSMIKILLIIALVLVGLVLDLGGGPSHDRIGFRYWKDPGAFNSLPQFKDVSLGRFCAFLSILSQAAFSFQGMEMCAVAASETESPRRNIAKAIRRVFYRILIFYLLGTFITGLIIPFNDPQLLQNTGNAAESPYVIVMTRAGIKVLPSIVNAAVLTSAFSACNSFLFSGSRVLYGLALRRQAPRIFAYCTIHGLPILAVLMTSCFTTLAFLNLHTSTVRAFNLLYRLTTLAGFITWWSMNLTFLQFYRGMAAQGIRRSDSIYYSRFQPWLAIWGLIGTTILIVLNGFSTFLDFSVADFVMDYIGLLIFLTLFVVWKFVNGTTIWKPHQMDFKTGVPLIEETEYPVIPPKTWWGKVAAVIF